MTRVVVRCVVCDVVLVLLEDRSAQDSIFFHGGTSGKVISGEKIGGDA